MKYLWLTVDKNSSTHLKKIDSLFSKKKPAMVKYVDREEEKLKQEVIVQRNNVDSVKIQTKRLKKLIRK